MQKAFDLIVERLEEKHKESENCPKFERVFRQVAFEEAIEIVNQVAEEYSHRNTDLVIDSSHRNEEMCEWIVDGPRYTTCTGNDFIQDDPCDWEYCPYCGKKIKVIE